jgi:hypothetical protein
VTNTQYDDGGRSREEAKQKAPDLVSGQIRALLMGGSPSWNELSNIQAMLGEKPDEFSDAAGSACKGGDAGGQPFNEGLPHALIIMASPSAKQ